MGKVQVSQSDLDLVWDWTQGRVEGHLSEPIANDHQGRPVLSLIIGRRHFHLLLEPLDDIPVTE